MDDIDDLKSRIGLATVIAEELGEPETRSCRWWFWRCPFHTDTTPSFGLRAGDESAHCFGCGWHGSIIDWLIERKHLSDGDWPAVFEELRRLANLPEMEAKPSTKRRAMPLSSDVPPNPV